MQPKGDTFFDPTMSLILHYILAAILTPVLLW
jgi:hypothetical protein